MPKISVIVPVYKVELYLHRCVDSILNQTFQDFELILVDDGSPDNCSQICDEYAQKDNRVFVIHKENGGQSEARNVGIEFALKNSDSDWIVFVDSDDWVHKDYLKVLYELVKNDNYKIGSCGFTILDQGEKGNIIDNEIGFVEKKYLNAEQYWTHCQTYSVVYCKIFKKDLWKNCRFSTGKIFEDEETMFDLVFSCGQVVHTDISLYYYFYNLNGTMYCKWNKKRLYILNVMENELKVLHKNNYFEAHDKVLFRLMNWYQRTIKEATDAQEKNEYRKEINAVRKGFGKFLRKHKKIYPMRHYTKEYCMAYPNMEKFIKIIVKIENRVESIFKKD